MTSVPQNADCSTPPPVVASRIASEIKSACAQDGHDLSELRACVTELVHEMLGRGCSVTETIIATKQVVLRADTPHDQKYRDVVDQVITCCIDRYYSAKGQ